ncbi:MAG: hypothetical protein O7D86_11030 [Proteobacteria bacterium]|nr:hypothetical protein [Pseudomonadota bacterium]
MKNGSIHYLNIVTGVSAIYYCLNKGNAFQYIIPEDNENDEIDISEDLTEAPSGTHYIPESWRIVDAGSGGLAVIKDDKPKRSIRVGELIGINISGDNKTWGIAVIRWLMVSREVHKNRNTNHCRKCQTHCVTRL